MCFHKFDSSAWAITDSNSNASLPCHELYFVCSSFRHSTSFIETRPYMRSERRFLYQTMSVNVAQRQKEKWELPVVCLARLSAKFVRRIDRSVMILQTQRMGHSAGQSEWYVLSEIFVVASWSAICVADHEIQSRCMFCFWL